MKNILLSATAIIALSSNVYAGDVASVPIDDAPEAEIGEWTVEASGEATYYGYYNDWTGLAGTAFSFEGEAEVEKALANGTSAGVRVKFEDSDATVNEMVIFYKSSIGEIAGGFQKFSSHGVEVPTAPSLDNLVKVGDDGLTFASPNLAKYAPTVVDYSDWYPTITYKSPEAGGFELGAGFNIANVVDVTVAGENEYDGTKVSIGASFAADVYNVAGTGLTNIGANIVNSGITYGAEYEHYNSSGNSYLTLGAGYNAEDDNELSPFAAKINYLANLATYDQGLVTAELQYETEEKLRLSATAYHELASGDSFASATVTQGIENFTLGATVGHFTSSSTTSGSAAIDFAINENLTIGASISHDGTNYGAASGLKMSF